MLSPAHQELLKTLGNTKRFEIMLHLMKGPLNVTQIIKKTGLQQTAASHHLRRLRRCRFVEVKENGREREYSVNKKTIGPFFDLLDEHAKKYCKRLCIPAKTSS